MWTQLHSLAAGTQLPPPLARPIGHQALALTALHALDNRFYGSFDTALHRLQSFIGQMISGGLVPVTGSALLTGLEGAVTGTFFGKSMGVAR